MQLSFINNICSRTDKNKSLIVLLFFIVFLFVGLSIYKDYGLSWDEGTQRSSNGYVNYNFIRYYAKDPLLNGLDKYHGPAFELVLVIVEKIFHLSDTREIYFMRHLLTFLVFFISSLFFYLLALKLFKNWKLAFIGVLLYVLSPHIFSHAFYNSKDSILLSFFTISIYLLIMFHERQTYFLAFMYSFVAAFTIDVRIVGIVLPAISFLLLLIELVTAICNKRKPEINGSVLLFFLLLIAFIILFWPVLWLNPVHHFLEALKENSNYYWNYKILYFGKYTSAHDLPWHYLIFWIFVSTPVIYSVLFLTGAIFYCQLFFVKPFQFVKEKKNEMVIFIWFSLPLAAIVLFKSVAFDTGRHMYFIHGAFILIAVGGVQTFYSLFRKRKTFLYFFNIVLICSFAGVIYKMIIIHPYEQLYFNEAMGTDMNKISTNFEMDYWGLAAREVLENILAKDSSSKITLYSENFPGELNAQILLPLQRKRIVYTNIIEKAKYYMADYRWIRKGGYPYSKEYYSATLGNACLYTAFVVRQKGEGYSKTRGKELITSVADFENKKENNWTFDRITKPNSAAHSGMFSTFVDSANEYSNMYILPTTEILLNKKNVVLKTSFWKYETKSGSDAKFVVSIESKNGTSYFWQTINEICTKEKTSEFGWEKITGEVDLPEIRSNGDIIKVYLWNVGKKQIFMDDVEIHFVQEAYN